MKPLLIFGLFFILSSCKYKGFGQINSSIEQYFNSLDTSKKQHTNHVILNQLQALIQLSEIDRNHNYLISSDNADAAAFTHIILATWLKEKRYKRVAFTSCAPSQTISDAGLKTLQSVGYKIERKNNEYFAQYAEKEKPIKFVLLSCSHKKALNANDMELTLTSDKTSANETSLHYQSGNTDETFHSLAVDFYAFIKELKKD